jgi:hypothetical protein
MNPDESKFSEKLETRKYFKGQTDDLEDHSFKIKT